MLFKFQLLSYLMVWRYKKDHAFQQQPEVEELVTVNGTGLYLTEREPKGA